MKQDARHRMHSSTLSTVPRRLLMAFTLIFLLAASVGGGFLYLYKKAPERLQVVTAWFSPVQTWMSERKANLHQNLSHIKQVAKTRLDPHPEIRFEFYNTLPGMKVSVPTKEELPQPKAMAQLVKPEAKPVEEAKSIRIFDPEHLQRSLDAELTKQRYIVQLGTFKKNASAERLTQRLMTQGFVVRSIPMQIDGRTWYRVQVGPYASREQAQKIQLQLKSQHLAGLLREQSQQ